MLVFHILFLHLHDKHIPYGPSPINANNSHRHMKHLIAILLSICPLAASAQSRSASWCPDNADGTYTNPVINADYSDPDVCVGGALDPSTPSDGEDYYLTASSFQCVPGLPILHSRDLVNWQIIGHALHHLTPASMFDLPAHGKGVWAPSIRYHNGQYYIFWGDPDQGIFMVKATNPAGPWDEPVCVVEGRGLIDPCPLWDDDGRCYLVNAWANSRVRFNSVLTMRELSADGTRAITPPVLVFDGNGTTNHTCEGPKLYKRDGWYWILCPAGGVAHGFQLAMRARSPFGPYEHKVVLAQGRTTVNGPHQGAWVHTRFGEDWFLHFQDKGPYGRVVHLQPVDWASGWPVMGRKGEPVLTYKKPKSSSSIIVNPAESDEFDQPRLGLQWQWQANYQQTFGMPTALGTMRIYTWTLQPDAPNLWNVPNMLLQKTPSDRFTATAKIRLSAKAEGQTGGIIMFGLSYSALVVRRVADQFQLLQLTCADAEQGAAQQETLIATLKPTLREQTTVRPALHEDIYLRMSVADGRLHFSWSADGKRFTPCGSEFQMREGKWVGARFGFVATDTNPTADKGWVEADWIRVEDLKMED